MTARPGRSAYHKKISPTGGQASLRVEAEARLTGHPTEDDLLHELRVHQIELEMQNEELRRTQLELEQSRDRYVDLYEFAPVGYVTLTKAGLIVSANLTAAALLSVERSTLLKSRLGAFVATEDCDNWHRFLVTMLRDDDQVRRTIDLRLRRGDGEQLDARLDCLRVITDGRSSTIRISLTDVTNLKQAERRFSLLASSTFEGIAITERGIFVDANEQLLEMLGYPREELIGLRVADMIAPEDREGVMSNILSGLESQTEARVIRKDGARITVEAHGQNYKDSGRNFRLTILRDITVRKEVEVVERAAAHLAHLRQLAMEQMLAEERERRALAVDLHDGLGQTLHIARIKLDGIAKGLPQGCPNCSSIDDLRDLITDASRETRSLTAKLSPPALSELGLVPALSWLVGEMERLYGLNVTLEDDGAPKPLPLAASVVLYRSVRELLINVAKHAGTDTARIVLRVDAGRLRITVEDKGIGMTEGRSSILAGNGFGLASTHERLIVLHGSMGIRSRPGDGTLVILEMPLEPSEAAP
jgi:PAS domain S-box-containing protein